MSMHEIREYAASVTFLLFCVWFVLDVSISLDRWIWWRKTRKGGER